MSLRPSEPEHSSSATSSGTGATAPATTPASASDSSASTASDSSTSAAASDSTASTASATASSIAATSAAADPPTGIMAWFAERPPAAGSAVMATGIISIGLRQVGADVLSAIALVLASLAWLALAEDFGRRLLRERKRWTSEAQTPPALTGVAASTVLGVRISQAGWQPVAVALLIIAALLWPLLLWSVLRHLRPHMQGAVFLVCVATQGLVTLSAVLAAALPAGWLLWPAVVLFVLGLVLYVDALVHFELKAVRDGAGDHWVAGGALAISALAGAKLAEAKEWTGPLHSTLRITAFVLLVLAWAWYAVLAAAEIRWPRFRYDVRRWATIFPMGMTGVATTEVAKATGWSWLTGIGHTLVWIAAVAWVLVFTGLMKVVAGQAHPRQTSPPDQPNSPR